MFVIDPDPYSLPCFRIGPFRTVDLSINHKLPDSDIIDKYLNDRFRDAKYIFTYNGRKAINLALASFGLKGDDVVTILTTSGNFYISGCVTQEIEKFCKWSRKIEAATKVILVNHEFGYPYHDLKMLKDLKLPIIEDCAASFFSTDKNNEIGNIGDFVIYSFPKMFPLQIGGLLVSNRSKKIDQRNQIDELRLRHIKNILSHYISNEEAIIKKRVFNFDYLKDKFIVLGFKPRFQLKQGIVPGVFMFQTNGKNIDLPGLKKYYYAHGVQCSVFYGEEAFYIPVHQALNNQDLDYFFEIIRSFIK
jgi:hypothetical protein